jgi:hypothetical protein
MKKLLPLLLLAGFSSPASADIIHQISASTQLRVDSAATQATRIGSTYAVSGNNIELGTTTTTVTGGQTTTSDMGGLTAGTSATSLDAATMVNGTYQIKTAGDAFSLTESFTLGDDAIDFTASTGGVTVEDLHATAATSTTSGGTTTTTPGTFAYGVVTEMPVFGDTTTTAGGHAGGLAGTIKSSGEITLTAGGAGTTATGQITSTLTIR